MCVVNVVSAIYNYHKRLTAYTVPIHLSFTVLVVLIIIRVCKSTLLFLCSLQDYMTVIKH